MKTVILAGGRGTRLSEYTHTIPKPIVEIGDHPILWHLMNSYSQFGYNDFILALGYKGSVIKDYFLKQQIGNSDFTIDLSSGEVTTHKSANAPWRVTLIDTGLNTMTGGRLKRLQPYLNETFMLTYGDGLANVNVPELLKFHKRHGKLVTVTAVHPIARFGEIECDADGKVQRFAEKPQTNSGWINGGFFVIEPGFLELIDGDESVLEKEPLETVSSLGQLMAYHHTGFWHCMDTVRDRDVLQDLSKLTPPPWMQQK